jgi:nucleotide-binding universal stress UspA family protein
MQVRRILVALAGTPVDEDLLQYAAVLAKAYRAKVLGVHVIEVRWDQSLDTVLERELERGETLLDEAAKLARRAGLSLDTELLQAREAAAAIVNMARERQVELIMVGMGYRKRLGKVYVGQTVQDVYVTAPCAVLAYRQPEPP